MSPDVYLVSNGPGELNAWVRPVVRRLAAEDVRVTVALVPCPYASGEEAAAVAAWPEAPAVWTPRETLGRIARGPRAGRPGVVVFMGGDQLFAVLLARRLGLPLLVYTDGQARWRGAVSRFLAADDRTYAALAPRLGARVADVGNLMVDAVQGLAGPATTREGRVLGLLPGSKPFKVRWVTPLFLRVAELLQAADPGLSVVLHRSPFTPLTQLAEAAANPAWAAVTGGATGRLEGDRLVTPGGAAVRILDDGAAGMAAVDVALTVPGTNTAELAALGVPMVVALPLHKPEAIPLDGLVGRVGQLPGVGAPLMRAVARRFEAKAPLVALPNQRAGRMVTPELLGAFPPERLAALVSGLLADEAERARVAAALRAAMGAPGAADRVVAQILAAPASFT